MPVRILLVTATSHEAESVKGMHGIKITPDGFATGQCEISLIITGAGSVPTAWEMTKWLSMNPGPDLAINIGIAGSYRDDILIGEVVVPVSDCFADAGVETAEGFLTLAEAGLNDPSQFPFKEGYILSENRFVNKIREKIRPVRAITLNTASGTERTIQNMVRKYNPDIETMEGATFFYICSREKIPFVAIRSISNKVEPRNRNKWNIQLALDNLTEVLRGFLLTID